MSGWRDAFGDELRFADGREPTRCWRCGEPLRRDRDELAEVVVDPVSGDPAAPETDGEHVIVHVGCMAETEVLA